MRIRKAFDGSIWIPRPDSVLEAKLDAEYYRVPGELRWFPACGKAIPKNLWKGKVCCIIGKGPSLDEIESKRFHKDEIILAINEAVNVVAGYTDNVFGIVQDPGIKITVNVPLIVNKRVEHLYGDKAQYVFTNAEYNQHEQTITAVMATLIAKHCGISRIYYFCFDAIENGELTYAEAIGHSPKGDPSRFLDHGALIEAAAQGVQYMFTNRTRPAVLSGDTPPQLSHNLEAHREPLDSQSLDSSQDMTD